MSNNRVGDARSAYALQRLLALALLAVSVPLSAATPDRGTLTPASAPLGYTVGPFLGSNPTIEIDGEPRCQPLLNLECDSYLLTVSLPAGFANNKVKVSIGWSSDSFSDYDLYVYAGDQTTRNGVQPTADVGDAPTVSNPEVVTFLAPTGATTVYTIKVVPYQGTPEETVTGAIELLPGDGGGGGGGGDESCEVPAGVRP